MLANGITESENELIEKLNSLAASPVYAKKTVVKYAFGGRQLVEAGKRLADKGFVDFDLEEHVNNIEIACISASKERLETIKPLFKIAS